MHDRGLSLLSNVMEKESLSRKNLRTNSLQEGGMIKDYLLI